MSEHTDACWAMPICLVCGRQKKPQGRSAPFEMANSLCSDHECPGYGQDPQAGHLWPGEPADEP
jgi:hypothetical protein